MSAKIKNNLDEMTEAEQADYYARTGDLSEFEGGDFVSAGNEDQPKRRSSIFSVRFTGAELQAIAAAAESAGVKPSAFIRQAAIAAALSDDDQWNRDRARSLAASMLREVADSLQLPAASDRQIRGALPALTEVTRFTSKNAGPLFADDFVVYTRREQSTTKDDD